MGVDTDPDGLLAVFVSCSAQPLSTMFSMFIQIVPVCVMSVKVLKNWTVELVYGVGVLFQHGQELSYTHLKQNESRKRKRNGKQHTEQLMPLSHLKQILNKQH